MARQGLSRRTFIKAGTGVGAAAAGGLYLSGACSGDYNPYDDYPVVPSNRVSLKKNGKSVLILGGGFGGMHAACELVDRGFDVTIIEKTSALGGKLKSYRDKTFGVPPANQPDWKGYPRDHGIHAVWGFYNNLREFMGRHGLALWRFPRSTTMYNFLDRDGTQSVMGNQPRLPHPLSLLETMSDINNFKFLSKEDREMAMSSFLKTVAFDFDDVKQRMYLDSISFPEWAREVGMPESMIYKFFATLTEMAMFDHIDNTSALYTLMTMALVAGHYKDMDIDVFMHPPGETYCEPLTRHILDHGGKILFNTPVARINFDKGKVKSVTAGDVGGVAPGVTMWRCAVCGSTFASPTKPTRCPTCGAPAAQLLTVAGGPPKDLVADYYVLAMDTAGAKDTLKMSGMDQGEYFKNIQKLESTGVYPVNLWYADCNSWKKRFPEHFDFFPSSFKYLGITLDWAMDGTIRGKKVCEPMASDYHGKGAVIIETQIANTERVEGEDDDTIARLVHEELKIVMPDLPAYTDFYVNRWDTYSPQRVGYEALRPSIQSPLDNLFLIGDWVKTDHLSVYMEKTNVSARMVTNLILDKAGQKEGKVTVLGSGTKSKILGLLRMVESPYP